LSSIVLRRGLLYILPPAELRALSLAGRLGCSAVELAALHRVGLLMSEEA
jgi:hypothetical protein